MLIWPASVTGASRGWFNVGGADDRLSHFGKNLGVWAPIIIARSPVGFVIWVQSRLAGKTLSIQRAESVERSASGISPEEVGLTLADGKTASKQVQGSIVRTQVNVLDTSWRSCRDCHGQHRVKDRRGRELDLRDCLINSWSGLTNYAHAYRHRLRISSAPAESSKKGKHRTTSSCSSWRRPRGLPPSLPI